MQGSGSPRSAAVWMLAGLLITIAFGRAFAEAEGKDPLTQDGPADDWAIKKPEKNLVSNSGFEEVEGLAPVGWRLEKGSWGAHNRTDQSTSRSGKCSVRVTCADDAHHQTVVSRAIPVKPKCRYRLTVWSKSTGGEFTYMLAWLVGPKVPPDTYRVGGIIRGPHEWCKSSFLFRTTAEAEALEVRLGIKYAATAWFDEVSFAEAPEGEVDNLIINSSFEYAANPGYPDAWNRIGYKQEKRFFHEPGYWELGEAAAYHGRYSLRIAAPLRTHSIWYEQAPVPCTFSLYVKANQPDMKFKMWCGNISKVFAIGTQWRRCSVTSTTKVLTLYFQPIFPGAGTRPKEVAWAEGRFGKALVFAPKTSVYLNDRWKGRDGRAMPDGTIEFWIKPNRAIDGSSASMTILLCRDNCRPYLYIAKSGALVWTIYDGKAYGNARTAPLVWRPDRWYHIAVTWGASGQKVYVNGELRGSNDRFTGTYEARRADSPWRLGSRGDVKAAPFEGAMDELRISSIARTRDALRAGPDGQPYEPDEHTMLLVHFDEEGHLVDSSKPEAIPPVYWVDAAQLEEGTEATAYRPGWRDVVLHPAEQGQPKKVVLRFSAGDDNLFDAPSLRIDGEPFIPVWIWGLTPEDSAALMGDGVNTALCGRESVASVGESGLKAIYCTPSAWRIREKGDRSGLGVPMTRERLLRLIRDEVLAQKENPAILAWFTCDEPRPSKGLTHDLLLDIYQTVKATGAEQPVYLNCAVGHAGREKNPEVVRDKFIGFVPAADMIGLDVYPVPRMPLDLVARQTDLARDHAPHKVTAMILQFFMGGRFLREPTPEELTSMWYLSLIHGARHIGLYSRKPTAPPLWEQMRELASETRILTPVLTSTEPSGLSTQAPDAYGSGIHCLARKHEGERYLIAVNAQPRSVECEFVVPGLRAGGVVKVLFEERGIPMAGGRFADRFRPYQRHVYRWDRR